MRKPLCETHAKRCNLSTRKAFTLAFTALLLQGCVSTDTNALKIATENTQTPIQTPQIAILDSGIITPETAPVDSIIDSANSTTNANAFTATNAPVRSPLKREFVQAPTNGEPTQVLTPDTTQTGVKVGEEVAAQQRRQLASIQADPQPVKKPNLFERIFKRRSDENNKVSAQPDATVITEPVVQAPSSTTVQPTPSATVTAGTNSTVAENTVNKVATETNSAAVKAVETSVADNSLKPATPTPVPVQVASAPTAAEPKPNLLSRLFGGNKRKKNSDTVKPVSTPVDVGDTNSFNNDRFGSNTTQKKPKAIKVVSRNDNTSEVLSDGTANATLPGVKSKNEIFGIKEETKSGKKKTQVASAGGLGRLSPNNLRLQHSKVQVACLKPGVLKVIAMVQRRFGKKPIITSGYRSPKRNRRAGGARNSQHVFCKAVDLQVEGVSKWTLAKYLRSIPGRGGVGTYCRTKSVHVDIGSKRDWHHPCRSSAKRKRKKA